MVKNETKRKVPKVDKIKELETEILALKEERDIKVEFLNKIDKLLCNDLNGLGVDIPIEGFNHDKGIQYLETVLERFKYKLNDQRNQWIKYATIVEKADAIVKAFSQLPRGTVHYELEHALTSYKIYRERVVIPS